MQHHQGTSLYKGCDCPSYCFRYHYPNHQDQGSAMSQANVAPVYPCPEYPHNMGIIQLYQQYKDYDTAAQTEDEMEQACKLRELLMHRLFFMGSTYQGKDKDDLFVALRLLAEGCEGDVAWRLMSIAAKNKRQGD